MAAVAWVPSESHVPVVVSGEIEGLRASSYRGLIPSSQRDAAFLVKDKPSATATLSTRLVHRYASVPAGSTLAIAQPSITVRTVTSARPR